MEGCKSLIWLNIISGQCSGSLLAWQILWVQRCFPFCRSPSNACKGWLSSTGRRGMAPSQPSPARLGELCCSFPTLTCSGGNCPFLKMEGWRCVAGGPTCTTAETSAAARTETWWPGAAFEDLAANKPLRPTRSYDQNTKAGCGMTEEPQVRHSHSWTQGTQCPVLICAWHS